MSTTTDPTISLPLAADDAAARRPVGAARAMGRRFIALDGLVLLGLALWTLLAVVLTLRQAAGTTFTGIQSLYPPDQFQYLTWVRDAGAHGLIGDNFQLLGSPHYDFFQPMFLISGALWRLGLSLPLAYLVWAPVAIVLTWWGFRSLVRRHLTGWAAQAALALSLCYMSPLSAWAYHRLTSMGGLQDLGGELSSATAFWGYFPRAIAVAVLPLLLLCLERSLEPGQRAAGRGRRFYIAGAAAAGCTAAWMHPWQGAIALFVIVGIALWSRPTWERLRVLSIPAVATAAPLLYYEVLARYDFYWRVGQNQSLLPPFSPLVLVGALFPLAIFALLGARLHLARSTHRRLLLLWVIGGVGGFFATKSFPPHFYDGLALPLSILAVQGWQQRVKLRAGISILRHRLRLSTVLAVACVAVCTVPGLVFFVQMFHATQYDSAFGMTFTADDNRALAYLDHAPGAGGVLAPTYIAAAVPPFTGRGVFAGQFAWTPRYTQTENTDVELFTGVLPPAQTRQLVEAIGARFVLVDCYDASSTLPAALGSDVAARHVFGCAAVYELRSSVIGRGHLASPASL